MPKRCKNGTKRNKKTGKCQPYKKQSTNKTKKTKRTNKNQNEISMPLNRVKTIMKYEKETFDQLYLGEPINDTLLKLKEKNLREAKFPKGTKFTEMTTYSIAMAGAIPSI